MCSPLAAMAHERLCRTDRFCCSTDTKSSEIKAAHVVNTILMLNVMEVKQVFLTVSTVTRDESISCHLKAIQGYLQSPPQKRFHCLKLHSATKVKVVTLFKKTLLQHLQSGMVLREKAKRSLTSHSFLSILINIYTIISHSFSFLFFQIKCCSVKSAVTELFCTSPGACQRWSH